MNFIESAEGRKTGVPIAFRPTLRVAALIADNYALGCLAAIGIWLVAWLLSFPNIYGWLTDDIYQFQRILMYESGGRNLADIPWFHAYDWFIVALPWFFHWSIPSYMVPQAWAHTGEFRAFILYTIVLHAVILGMTAYLLQLLCKNRFVAFAALLLFMTSPTFVFYSDLLDSRYLGLLAGVPAIILLLKAYDRINEPQSVRAALISFLLPGFLIGLGQSIHYTLTYFAGPIGFVYCCYALAGHWKSRTVWTHIGYFVLGLALWFVPVQLLSLQFHPFSQSMLGILTGQVTALKSPYDKISDLTTWIHFFLEDMGLPMMILVVAGAIFAYRDDLRPAYLSRFYGRLMSWSSFLATAYLLITPSIAFYRQVALYQIFYMLFAAIAIDVFAKRLFPGRTALRSITACAVFLLAAWVPSVGRMPEVFFDSQGLGRAINTAHAAAGSHGKVYFIEFYDIDLHPLSIISRQDFNALKPGDMIVTDFPTLFFAKYPDIFALLHDTHPIASYPTEWCTRENWVEERTYWNFRRYQDEPESCNAQVYSVAAIRKAQVGKVLRIASVRADSTMAPKFAPSRVFALRSPAVPMYMTDCCNAVPAARDLWASDGSTRNHWIDIRFARAAQLSTVTVVSPNYFSPPAWDTVARPQFVSIYGDQLGHHSVLLWRSGDLRDSAIYTATFRHALVSGIRLVIQQPPVDDQRHAIIFYQRLSPSPIAGITYVRFPGYSVRY